MLNKICFLLKAFLERFLNAWGIAFHPLTPVREKEFTWIDSLEAWVRLMRDKDQKYRLEDSSKITYLHKKNGVHHVEHA